MTPRSKPDEGQNSTADLVEIVGEAAAVALAENFGGTRLYVPQRLKDCHPIVRAIGADAGKALVEAFHTSTIKVPLARELRARHYRAAGLSHAKIAARLGLTESGVRGLFKRIDAQA